MRILALVWAVCLVRFCSARLFCWFSSKSKTDKKVTPSPDHVDGTPIILDLVTPNETKLDVYTETESGVSFKTVTPKSVFHISSVVDSGATLWEASGYEKCLLVESYAKNTTKVIYLETSDSTGTKSKYFEKADEAWSEIDKEVFVEKIEMMIEESGKDGLTLDISHPNRLLCKSFDYSFAGNAIKLVVSNKGVSISRLVNGTEEVYTRSSGETFEYARVYLNKDGTPELILITLRTLSGISRRDYVKTENGWSVCNNSDATIKSLRDPTNCVSSLRLIFH
ncbi:signal peptide-containing protein [Theileria equi strain WA]|uniref:Signal peptide-containing protein n=1 Tax=Theileria equi strain WA TaxID=1537102 RepID=L0AZE6_THEEQ|nr:signal peptide-containing protein [Theileria equi strain WA]AFZ80643.1 signal peptide-containing protein [Theileria equi strain WA]|eukprot:XP_004830309.1 signal peptide-containing protein [Theileria equi strain WA]